MTKSKWQLLLSMFAIFAIVAFAAACGDDDDDDNGGSGGASPTSGSGATTVAKPSGTITIGATQFESWDPHFSDFAADITHFVYVWRGLYHLDLQDKPQPAMADGAPTVSADGKTYTIKIKKDLKWSDGDALDANDFVLGIQRTCNPDIAGHYQYILTNIVGCDDYYGAGKKTADEKAALLKALGVRAVDANTLEIKLANAQPTFATLLAMWPTFPAPKHKLATVDAKWPAPLDNVYNGPFMPSKYTEKASLELVPNPNWSGTTVGVEKVVVKYVDDPAVLNQAYRAGEIDATVANKAELDKLKSEFTASKELNLYPATRTIGIEYNLADPVMKNPDVRLALSQATDRTTMMKVVFKDANTATTNWVPPVRNGLKGGEYDSILGYDLNKAKASLAKAGFADGKGLPTITLIQVDSATNKLAGDFLTSEWKKIGVNLEVQYVDSKTRQSAFNTKQYQLVLGGWQEDYPDPENWFIGLWETGGSINKTNTSIAALDKAIADSKYNTNDEARRKGYRDAEKLLLEQASGIAPIYHTLAAFLVKPQLSGMVENKRPADTFVPGDWYIELWKTSKKS
jgi:oligopeptide transport system substrate-binding protein